MVRRITSIGTAVVVFAATAMIASAAPATAQSQDRAPTMTLGAPAPMPEGFVALCQRDPAACPATGAIPDAATLRLAANRRYWLALFGPPTPAPAASAEGVDTTSAADSPPSSGPSAYAAPAADAGGAISAADIATPALEVSGDGFADRAMSVADVAPIDPMARRKLPGLAKAPVSTSVFTLDREGWRLVNRINRGRNRAIRHVADQRLYGRDDHWTIPSDDDLRGDCEDFVLAKRADLIAAGVPAETLSIAIVETASGEAHAVLLIASDQGEFVLDSLSPWIARWDRVAYRWRERQRPGRPFDWVRIAA